MYILNVLFTPCNLHWVFSTSSSWMIIMLLNSRSAWQSTGYPWKSLVKLVNMLYEATIVSRTSKLICRRNKTNYTGYNLTRNFDGRITCDESGSTCNRLWETSKIFRFNPVKSYGDKSVILLWLILSLLSVVMPISDPPSDSNSLWSNFKCSIPVTRSLII